MEHVGRNTYHQNTTAALFLVFMSRYPQHRAGGMAAPCRARHTSVLVAAHVAIRHMKTADGIRSTADTITAAPDTTTTGRHVPHVLTSPTACRPHSNFQRQHVTRPHPPPEDTPTRSARPATVAERWNGSAFQLPPRTAADTPPPRQHLPRPIRPRFTPYTPTTSAALIAAHTAKKSPSRLFSVWGYIFYSVTSFTISSAVFPSRARTNFDLVSPRFTSGMCFSASLSSLASPGVNLFNRSKIAKP